MRKKRIDLAKRSMALLIAVILTFQFASAAASAKTAADIEPAAGAEAAGAGSVDISLEDAIEAETVPADEQVPEPEAAVTEESVTAPEAEESDEEVTAEEETSGEGFEAGEYAEQIDGGAEEAAGEGAAEEAVDERAAEEEAADESTAEEDEEAAGANAEAIRETEASGEAEDAEDAETARSEEKEADAEEETPEPLEGLDGSEETPYIVGSVDSGLVSQLACVGSVTVNPGAYSPYFNSQSSGGVGAGTQQYTVTQNGKTYTAYCAEPEYVGVTAPSNRNAYEITDSSFNGWGANIRKVMYFTYGAPGGKSGQAVYDKLMAWVNADLVRQTNPPTTRENLAYAYSHVIVSKAFNDMKNNIGYGGPNSLWSIGATGAFASAIGTVQDIVNTAYAQANAPAGFRVFLIPSTTERSQSFMYWSYNPEGSLQVKKLVRPKDNWANAAPEGAYAKIYIGGKYSPKGIIYNVYSDAGCTKKAGSVTMNEANGYGEAWEDGYYTAFSNVITLPVGTYYVREDAGTSYVNPNLTVDTQVHTVKVGENNKASNPAIVTSTDHMESAWLLIVKRAAEPGYKASLGGAEFKLYKWYDGKGNLTGPIGTLTTHENGATDSVQVPIFDYLWVKEVKAPAGYEPIEEPFKITGLKKGWENRHVETVDEPVPTGSLQVIKQPEESAREITAGNDCYSLKGAVFEVYSDKACTKLVEGGILTTDAEGRTEVLRGLSIGDYYIIEKKASPGFGLPVNSFTKKHPYKTAVTEETIKGGKPVEAECREPLKNDPISIVIDKTDAEGEEIRSLADAKFAINYYNGTYTEDTLPAEPMRTWVVKTIAVKGRYQAGLNLRTKEDKSFIEEESDPLYITASGKPTLPYGTVSVVELEAPDGYIFEKGKVLGVFAINENYRTEDGFVMVDGVATLEAKVNERRSRCGVSFTKVDDAGTKLANIPFLVKNKKSGEQHVMLTDANGVLSTEADRHSVNTNANDAAYAGGVLDESKLDASAGVWFSGRKETDLTYLDDARGALPYGDYTFTELRSSANEGMSLVAPFTVKIDGTRKDGEVINLGNKIDRNKNIITSVTSGRTGTQIALAEKNAEFADSVTLSGYKGESTVTTKIYDIEANRQLAFADGKTEIVTKVTANGRETRVDVPFRLDASALAGRTVAVVTIVENAGETTMHNADFSDEAEKIYFPLVSTRATVDGGKAAAAGGVKTIVDRVTYAGFPEGTSVKAVAEAVKKGATAAEDAVLAAATKEASLKASGTINTKLFVDTDALGGAGVYINEKIYVTVGGKDILVAQESGRTDNNQNVSFVEISTKVVNAKSGSGLAFAKKDAAFTDALTIAGFTGDVTAVTKLYNMTDGAYAAFADGTSEITTTIAADGSEQTIGIPFNLDGTAYAGKVLAVETSVTGNGQTFKHNEVHDDKAETIYFPTMTTAAEGDNGHYVSPAVAKKITDTITWAGMPEGIVLTTKTRVFILGEDASRDKEITEAAVTNTYAVEATDGSREVTVTLNTEKYAGKTLYITEEDYVTVDGREVLVAAETDREAIDQYIYIPKLITKAVETETKEKTIPAVGIVSITDTVNFSGFRAGEKLKTVTEVWAKGKTAEDDILIKSVGGTYTTKTAKGSYDVVLEFALTDDIAGKPVYVVEKNYIGGVPAATEGSRDNESQTVTPAGIATTLTDTKTETHIAYAGPKVELRDEIKYTGLIKGRKYKFYGLLQNEEGYAYDTKGEVTAIVAADALWPDKDLGEDDEPMKKEEREAAIEKVISDNDLIYAEAVRTAEAGSGSFFVDFEFDGVPFKGKKTVAAEGLYDEGDGKLLAIHSNPKDKDQTEEFPEILTTAADKATGTRMVGAFDGQAVIDRVDYRLMGEGTGIITVTELIRKGKTAEEDEVVKTIRSRQTVSGEGSYEIEIPFDAGAFAGDTLYVTERNYIVKEDGTEELISDHVDRDDESQTVYVPKLITSAADAKDGTKLVSVLDGGNAKVIDTVNYENMVPGTQVITVAKLFVKGGTAEDDTLVTEVRAEAARLIETACGSYEVELPFDAAAFEGKSLYAAEENYLLVTKTDEAWNVTEEEVLISEHSDRDDEEQTVKVPEIGTTLTDSETQTHISLADAEVTNNDEVAYKNLTPGRSYPIVTIYMDELGHVCRKDGTVILESGFDAMHYYSIGSHEDTVKALEADNVLYAVTGFTPDAENGSVTVPVKYDGRPFMGRKVVAAEGVFEEGRVLAAHIEPEDEGQTVYLPKIITTAVDGRDGDKKILAGNDAAIRDTLVYEMYPEGTEITTVLELYDVETGKPIVVDGRPVTKTETFTAGVKGRKEITVTFNTAGLGGKKVGLVETNYLKTGGKDVVVSRDTYESNKDQIVEIQEEVKITPSVEPPKQQTPPKQEKPRKIVKTGDESNALLWIGIGMVAALILFVMSQKRKRNHTERT